MLKSPARLSSLNNILRSWLILNTFFPSPDGELLRACWFAVAGQNQCNASNSIFLSLRMDAPFCCPTSKHKVNFVVLQMVDCLRIVFKSCPCSVDIQQKTLFIHPIYVIKTYFQACVWCHYFTLSCFCWTIWSRSKIVFTSLLFDSCPANTGFQGFQGFNLNFSASLRYLLNEAPRCAYSIFVLFGLAHI